MYIIGFIKTERTDVLINPVSCTTTKEIYQWLVRFFNPKDFTLTAPVTQEPIDETMDNNKVGRINMNGYEVALLFGKTEAVQEATTRFIHLTPRSTDNLDFEKVVSLVIPD